MSVLFSLFIAPNYCNNITMLLRINYIYWEFRCGVFADGLQMGIGISNGKRRVVTYHVRNSDA